MNKKQFVGFLRIFLVFSCPFGLYCGQSVLVNIDFEEAEAGSLGDVHIAGQNPGIKVGVVEGFSSDFTGGNKSLKYVSDGWGGPDWSPETHRMTLILWSHGRNNFQNIQSGDVRIAMDIMFESLSGMSLTDYHGRPVTGPLGDGIRIDGAPFRCMYFIIGFANDNSMGIYFHTPVGNGWIHPDAVWKIEKNVWYRIELILYGLDKGGSKTAGIPERFSARVSTTEKTIFEIEDALMSLSWIDYYESREEPNQSIYDGLGVKEMRMQSSLHAHTTGGFGLPGATYELYIDNLVVEHIVNQQNN